MLSVATCICVSIVRPLRSKYLFDDIRCSLVTGAKKRPHTASVVVGIGEEATFDAIFKPKAAYRSQAQIRLSVIDNQYEDSVILLVGEGYEDDITLDNIHSVSGAIDPEHDEGNMAEDDVAGRRREDLKVPRL